MFDKYMLIKWADIDKGYFSFIDLKKDTLLHP